ncbi:MAG: CDP-diacylglycerol--glycerol-3-phosphate 3-phosphatidyltransferase [Bdellovibrionales bacterium]|nr:CDP-diacylglycerol--glycerol-3-phosphate 3-phosphatidyltransferase [Bdellovibrionales bacterium]
MAEQTFDESQWSTWLGRRAPNFLTILRILVVPVFVVLLIDPTPVGNVWACIIFVAASITDWLDGHLARIYNAESITGKLLDPLADKILVMSALVMLAAVPIDPRVPAWIVVVLLAREMVVTGLRSIAAAQGIVVAATSWAKHKTAWTMIAIPFLLVHTPYEIGGVLIDFHACGMTFLYVALILSVGTGFHYGYLLRRIWTEE